MLREKLKSKFFEDTPILDLFVKKRQSVFSSSAVMHKISTGLHMLYLWPVKKLFSKSQGLGLDFYNFSRNYYADLQDLFHIYAHGKYNLIRVGAEHDGGYIMLDDFAPVNELSNLRGGA